MVSGVSCDTMKIIISYKRINGKIYLVAAMFQRVQKKVKTDADEISIIVPPDKCKLYLPKL